MKRILTILTVALAVASCDNDEHVEPTQGPAIAFGEVGTRVAITDENVDEVVTEFGVWSEINTGDEGTAEADVYIDLLSNERVYKSGGNWTYDNTRYWVYDRTFHFFATWPYTTSGVEKVTLTGGYSGYKVPFTMNDAADQELLIAHKTERPETGGTFPTQVDIDFEHALTSVTFKIKQDFGKNQNDNFRVMSASLTGIKKSGTFYTSRFADYTDNWVTGSETISFSYDGGENPTQIRDLTDQALLPFGELLVVPQKVASSSVALTVDYQFQVSGGTEWDDKQGEIFLPSGNWPIGSKVVYTVSLHEDNSISIKGVDVTISSWGGSNPGGTIIIK